MCGIAGILYKDGHDQRHEIGQALIGMLDGFETRRIDRVLVDVAIEADPAAATGYAGAAQDHETRADCLGAQAGEQEGAHALLGLVGDCQKLS